VRTYWVTKPRWYVKARMPTASSIKESWRSTDTRAAVAAFSRDDTATVQTTPMAPAVHTEARTSRADRRAGRARRIRSSIAGHDGAERAAYQADQRAGNLGIPFG
jgi:hypothetical protein